MLLAASIAPAAAQTVNLIGKLKSQKGDPVEAATIKDRTSGTTVTSDKDGNYRISLTVGAHVLEISAKNMQNLEEAIQVAEGQTSLPEITLITSGIDVPEVVIIGYGTTTKRCKGI